MPRISKTSKRKPSKLAAQVNAFERASKLVHQIEQDEAENVIERPRRKRQSPADKELVSNAYYGLVEGAKKALAAGASPDARQAESNHTALYLAVAGNHLAMVELLLEHGADPNATVIANIRGLKIVEITPLTRAKDEGKRAIARVLERHGGQYVRNDAAHGTERPPTTSRFARRGRKVREDPT